MSTFSSSFCCSLLVAGLVACTTRLPVAYAVCSVSFPGWSKFAVRRILDSFQDCVYIYSVHVGIVDRDFAIEFLVNRGTTLGEGRSDIYAKLLPCRIVVNRTCKYFSGAVLNAAVAEKTHHCPGLERDSSHLRTPSD